MLDKLKSRKLWITILTVVGAIMSQDEVSDQTRLIVGGVAVAYVIAQALVDSKAKAVADDVREGLDRGEQ